MKFFVNDKVKGLNHPIMFSEITVEPDDKVVEAIYQKQLSDIVEQLEKRYKIKIRDIDIVLQVETWSADDVGQ